LYGASKVELVHFPADGNCKAQVELATGSHIRARRVVMAAGPWTTALASRSFNGLAIPLDIWEVTFGWYKLNRDNPVAQQLASALPVWRAFGGVSRCYGFPTAERKHAVKVAPHGHADLDVVPEPSRRTGVPNARYIDDTSVFAASLFGEMLQSGAGGVELEPHTCLYSVTRDGSFVIDWVPEAFAPSGTVIVLAGFCGSGFKHGPLIGRLVAEMMVCAGRGDMEGMRRPASFPDLEPFSLRRPTLTTSASNRLLSEHAVVHRARI
jgi:sarcosine oxidase/L-pipecolate oxidase